MKTILRTVATSASALALALGAGTAAAAPAATNGDLGVECTRVWQYTVNTYGDMTNAESGGSFVGWAIAGDTFNVRIQGNPRYYGANVNNGKWGWVLASKLSYTGNTWCA